jgi:hypothetical protein
MIDADKQSLIISVLDRFGFPPVPNGHLHLSRGSEWERLDANLGPISLTHEDVVERVRLVPIILVVRSGKNSEIELLAKSHHRWNTTIPSAEQPVDVALDTLIQNVSEAARDMLLLESPPKVSLEGFIVSLKHSPESGTPTAYLFPVCVVDLSMMSSLPIPRCHFFMNRVDSEMRYLTANGDVFRSLDRLFTPLWAQLRSSALVEKPPDDHRNNISKARVIAPALSLFVGVVILGRTLGGTWSQTIGGGLILGSLMWLLLIRFVLMSPPVRLLFVVVGSTFTASASVGITYYTSDKTGGASLQLADYSPEYFVFVAVITALLIYWEIRSGRQHD